MLGLKVRPQDEELVDIGALDCGLSHEPVCDQLALHLPHPHNLFEAMICEKRQQFTLVVQLLCLVSTHESEGLSFIFEQLIRTPAKFFLTALELPLGWIFLLEELFLLVSKFSLAFLVSIGLQLPRVEQLLQ